MPAAAVGSTGSIVWSWTAASGATSYELALATKTSEILAAPVLASCTLTGLAPNSLSEVVVRGSNTFGAGPFSSSAAAYSFAAPALSPTVLAVTTDTVSLSWGANGNPAGTLYALEKSSNGLPFVTHSSYAATTALVGQLVPGATYEFRLVAFNGDGIGSEFSTTVSTRTDETLPGMPGTPAPVVLSTGDIQWAWAASPRAAQHLVFDPQDLVTPLAVVAGAGVTFTGLAANSAQSIVVVGTNVYGAGPASPAASTHTFAAVPAGLTVLGVTSIYVSLSWTANGNPAGTVYEVQKATDGVGYLRHSTYTVAGATVAGLSAGTSYYFQVRAFNEELVATAFTGVVSTLTDASGGVPPPGPAGAPSAASISTGDVVWQWTVASDADGYRVYLATRPDELLGTAASTGYAQTPLGPNAAAAIVVVPFNEVDVGPTSSSGTARTWARPPVALAVTSVAAHSAYLSWSADGNPGGTVYEVQKATDGASFAAHSTYTTVGGLADGLTAGTTYDFQVRAINQAGVPSAFSASVSTRTDPALPGEPGTPSATVLSTGSLSWAWTAALDAASYEVVLATSLSTVVATPTANSVAFADMGANSASIIRVRGVNALGPGPLSPGATAFTFADTPSALTVAGVTSLWASLTWSAGANPADTVFELQKSTDGTSFTIYSTYTVTAATVASLSASSSYYFKVRAYNEELAATPFSATVSTLTDASGGLPPPGPAGGPAPVLVSTGDVVWEWAAASDAAGYRVYLATKPAEQLGTAASTGYAQVPLGPNAAAAILVVPYNATDLGPASSSGTARTLARPPTALAFTAVSSNSAALSWNADGNPAGTVFEVEMATDGVSFASESTGTATTDLVEGLTPGATYDFRVRAFNGGAVATAYSGTVSTVTPVSPPGPPGIPAPTAVSTDTVSWAWTAAAGATSYEVRRASNTAELLAAPASTGVVFLGLGPNAASGIVVRGVNLGGGGPLTAAATAFTHARPPTALSAVAVTSVSIGVSWSPDGDPPGTVFEVQVATEGGAFAPYSTTTAAALTVGGLTPAATYSLQVRAYNGDAVATAFSGAASTRTLAAFPGLPGVPVGTALSTADVSWTWAPSSNAVSYEVRLATDTGQLLAAPATNSVVLGGYGPNGVSSVVVRGLNAAGAGPLSDAGSVHALAAVPVALSVAAVSSVTVELGWSGADNAPGTVYEVQTATAGGSFATWSTAALTIAFIEGLTPSAAYDFRVRAFNAEGLASAFTGAVSTTTLPPGPGATGIPAPTATSTDSVSWAWSAAAGATGYEVRRASDPAELLAAPASPAVTLGGLGPNAASAIVVRGVNATGPGPLTAPTTAYSRARVPSGLAVVSVGSGTIGVSWSADGNPAGTLYEVQLATLGGPFGAFSTTTATAFTLGGLLSEATYSLQVAAYNGDFVVTAFSASVSTLTAAGIPGPPGTPVPTVLSTGGVSWAWAPAADAESYELVLASDPSQVLAAPAGTSATLTGLATNSVSSVVVRGVNVTGTGPPSVPGSAYTFAEAPSALAVGGVTSLWARLSWSGGANPAGTLFRVEKSTDDAVFTAHSTYAVAAATVTGLSASTTYYFRVAALNGALVASAFSNTASTQTDASGGTPPPGPPGAPVPVTLSTGDVSWSWAAASDATSYKVFLATKTAELLAAPAGTSVILSLYGPNSVSSVVVRGVNEVEDGPFAAAASTWTFAGMPGTPALVAVGSASVSLSWTNGGNPPGTRFELETSVDGGAFALSSATFAAAATVAPLAADTTVEFRLRALNGNLVGTAYTAGVTTRTFPPLPGAPGTPAGLALSTADVGWAWGGASNAAGYQLFLATKTSELLAVAAGTSVTLHGFGPNSPSDIVVRGVNPTGAGGFSASAVVYSSAAAPAALTLVAVGSASVSLSWSAAGNPAGTQFAVEAGSDGVTFLDFSTTTAAALVAGALIPETTYWFRVRALNGDSAPTAYAAAVTTRTLPAPPGLPGTPAAVVLSTGDVSWSWTPGAGAAGYQVYRASQTAELVAAPAGAGFTLTGLGPNAPSGIVVRSVNQTAASALSAAATAYTFAAEPTGFGLSSVSSAAIGLSWSGAGNPPGTVFELQGSTDGAAYATTSTTTASAFVVAALPPGTTYSFRLRAANADALYTAFTAVVTTRTRPAPPAVPGVPSAVALSTGDVSWQWAPAAWAASYRLVRASDPAQVLAAVTTTTALLSGLAPNALSGVAVQALNETAASALTAAATAYSLALAPAALAVAQVGTGSVVVAWDPGTNSAGTVFEVLSSTDGASFTAAGATTAASLAVGALASGTTYFLRARAVNGDGLATAVSNTVSTRTVLPAPAAPGVPAGVALSTGDVRWQWAASSGATSYQVVLASATGSLLAAPATSSVVLTGFGPNSVSSVAVRGLNVDGAGALSGAASLYTLAAVPASLAFVSVTSAAASLAWDASGNPAGTLFRLELSTDGAAYGGGLSGTAPAQAVSGLLPGATYFFRVRAENADAVATAFSNAVSTVTRPPLPGPTGTPAAVALSTGDVSWTWAASSYAAAYEVYLASKTSERLAVTASPAVLLSGYAPNSRSAIVVRGANPTGTGPLSSAATAHSLADAPGALAVVAVTSASVSLTWSPGANPAGTVYALEAAVGTGAFAAAGTTTSAGLTAAGLGPSLSHAFRVRALNEDLTPSAYSGVASTVTLPPLPAAPAAPAGTALGVSSVSWTWAAAADASSYLVYTASSPADVIAAATTTAYVQTGLAANTTAALRVAGLNVSGLGPQSAASAAVYTLANAPSGSAAAAVHATSVTLSWALNGNPVGTSNELQRSTDGTVFALVSSGTGTARSATGLLVCTSYFFRVRNLNGAGAPSPFDAAVNALTSASSPTAPSGLQAAPAAGNRVVLTWDPSPSESVVEYRLYWDSGTGVVSYAAPFAVVPSSSLAFTSGVLPSSAAYRFALRAFNRCGLEEGNTGVLASAPSVASLTGVKAGVTSPQGGKRVKGDSLTLAAALTVGAAADVARVVFQYKSSSASLWTDIATDTAEPYFVHWNADALGVAVDQAFDLRAVAADVQGSADAAPSAVTVTVTPAASTQFDVAEGLVGGKVSKSQQVDNAVSNTVQTAGAAAGGVLTKLVIPAGALADANTVVTVVSDPAGAPAAPSGVESVGVVSQITLSNGQTALSGGQTAAVTLGYPDADGNGVIDGTTIRVDRLQMYSAQTAAGPWVRDFSSSVDTANRSVTGLTPHFSFFALFVGAAADLASLRVYPVPFMPNNGDPDDGVPYAAGNANSGIVFDNLPPNTTIKVYTVTGQRVAEFTSSGAGKVQWDVKNDRGRDVASGGYVAVVTSPGVFPVVKKLLVVR